MSVYDSVWFGPYIRIEPDLNVGGESVALKIHYKDRPGGDWCVAWAQNGGTGDVVIPLRMWEELQGAGGGPPYPGQ